MKEFTLNSAEKYKDGSPMMTDLPVQLVRLIKRIEFLEKKVHDCQQNQERVLMRDLDICEGNIDDLDYRLEEIERKVYEIHRFLNSVAPDFFAKIQDEMTHKGSNFCGNCMHCDHGKQGDDEVYVCELSAEIVDPDSASCSMFEPPF